MRSLIVRFKDCEGPGILEGILKKKGYRITYHNAYDRRIQIVPEAHLMFDLVILLGGPQSVVGTKEDDFFSPYYSLAENMIDTSGRKLIGICLGSQIIAKVLGAKVEVGAKGPEVGFSEVQVQKKDSPVFQGVPSEFLGFHLHEDSFDLPKGSEHLLSSALYPNQMFSFKNKAFGIQVHLEPTLEMLEIWRQVHAPFIQKAGALPKDLRKEADALKEIGTKVFENILGI